MGQPVQGVRAAKAAATRARVLDAARQLFIRQGYENTTMQAIADAGDVAVQTLYFTFGNKRTILSEVLDVAVAGDTAPVVTLERPWVAEAMAAPPAELIERLVVGTGAIHARVAQVLEVVRSAAGSDPEIADLWQTNLAQRHTVFVAFAGALAGKVPLRDGLTTVRAADIMLAVLSPETYGLLVTGRGWSGDEWVAWASDVLLRQLVRGSS